MYYVISIILGLLPEVLYFTLFLIYTKDLKEKKLKLFALITIAYTVTIFIRQYVLIYYLMFIVLIYIVLKLLYKKKIQIIDIFIITFAFFYLTIISYLCFLFMAEDRSNYYLLYLFDRLLLFGIFAFKNKFNKLYKIYCKLWNRNDSEKRPIKSITLRNISLISINFIICFMNIYMMLIL